MVGGYVLWPETIKIDETGYGDSNVSPEKFYEIINLGKPVFANIVLADTIHIENCIYGAAVTPPSTELVSPFLPLEGGAYFAIYIDGGRVRYQVR